ncbi:MAG: AAA family ATPase, partial [Gaiellaceae bacterium]
MIGPSCSGKTTLSRELAQRLGVPHVELDALHHDAGWTEAPAELFQSRVRAALEAASGGWVADGNYYGKLGSLVVDQADTVVWLEVPYTTAIRRVLWRTWSRLITRTVLWNGNRERLRDTLGRNSIVWWVLTRHRTFAAKWNVRLAGHPHVVRVRDASAWLQSIQATPATSGSSGA